MIHDFGITAGLRARRLTVIVAPEARVEAVGEGVAVSSRERREGLPRQPHSRDTYADLAVEKEVLGELRNRPPA